MTAETFDPKTEDQRPLGLTMTPRAIAHVQRQLARMPGKSLRLGVKESGCSGYKYELDYIEAPDADDHNYNVGDTLQIYIRNQHLAFVRGTEIDLVTEGLNAALRFKNPNAESECGCGESFSVNREASA